jgi:tetratricopeptide (TPR) repeat protein
MYARERAEDEEPPAEREAALRRLIGWYTEGLEKSYGVLGHRARLPGLRPAEPGGPALPRLTTAREAVIWCAGHFRALSASIDEAPRCGRPDLAWRIAMAMMAYALVDAVPDWQGCLERALRIAREHDARVPEAWLLNRLGVCHGNVEHTAECLAYLEQAVTLHRATGDAMGEAVALGNLIGGYVQSGQFERALDCGKRALDLVAVLRGEFTGNVGVMMHNIGDAAFNLNRLDEAAAYFRQAIDGSRQDGQASGVVKGLNTLGDVYRAMGCFDEALTYIEESRALAAETGQRRAEADALHTLGRLYREMGRPDRARDAWQRSLVIFREARFDPGVRRVEADLSDLIPLEAGTTAHPDLSRADQALR